MVKFSGGSSWQFDVKNQIDDLPAWTKRIFKPPKSKADKLDIIYGLSVATAILMLYIFLKIVGVMP